MPAAAAPDDPEEFADWFAAQEFTGKAYYEWASVLDALTDGIDRTREATRPVETPVYVAIRTGTKYHNDKNCSALSLSTLTLELDISEAIDRGFEACSRCK